MIEKKGFAAFDFSYKNCFDGHNLVFKDKALDEILDFVKGNELPQILVDRLFSLNPEHVVFDKPVVEKKEEAEIPEVVIDDEVFSEKRLIEMNKEEQIEILRKRGVEGISKLKSEKERVEKILETNPEVKK